MEEYKVELVNPDQFDHLIPLMRDCFGIDVDVDYFKWKFLNNPAGKFIGFVAISKDGEYASYYGVIPELYQFGETQRIIYQSCDTMTHSGHRRKGLFQLLAKECYRYLSDQGRLFVIGFGGGQSTPGFLKFGWKKVFDVAYLFRPRILSTVSRFKMNFALAKNFRIADLKSLEEIVSLRMVVTPTNRVSQVLNEDFVKWRLSNPRIQYVVKFAKEIKSDTLVGYFIYYHFENKIILFDLFSTRADAIPSMKDALDQISNENNSKGIITISQLGVEFSNSLRQNGFWVNPFNWGPLHDKIPFIFYSPESELVKYNDSTKWQIIPFCHDAF